MIAHLFGILTEKEIDNVVVDVGGVGYAVLVSTRTVEALPSPGDEVRLLIHTQVREDAFELFGFAGPAEREIFRRLISVSGIGCKTAINALGVMAPKEIHEAIAMGDERALSRMPGVGKKTARRIILDLSDKLTALPAGGHTTRKPSPLRDLELALNDLGYKPAEIDPIVRAVSADADEDEPVESLLRKALSMTRR